ncbi:IS256 family transposase, partial [Pseudomonas sp. TNT2022 ID681]|nr:IS256 family transposase [Pseudomonas fontis]
MPTKKKPARQAPRELPKIPKELLEQFGDGLMTAEAIEDASAAFKMA